MNFLFDKHFWIGIVLGTVSYLIYFFLKSLLFFGGLLWSFISHFPKAIYYLLIFGLIYLTIDGCLT